MGDNSFEILNREAEALSTAGGDTAKGKPGIMVEEHDVMKGPGTPGRDTVRLGPGGASQAPGSSAHARPAQAPAKPVPSRAAQEAEAAQQEARAAQEAAGEQAQAAGEQAAEAAEAAKESVLKAGQATGHAAQAAAQAAKHGAEVAKHGAASAAHFAEEHLPPPPDERSRADQDSEALLEGAMAMAQGDAAPRDRFGVSQGLDASRPPAPLPGGVDSGLAALSLSEEAGAAPSGAPAPQSAGAARAAEELRRGAHGAVDWVRDEAKHLSDVARHQTVQPREDSLEEVLKEKMHRVAVLDEDSKRIDRAAQASGEVGGGGLVDNVKRAVGGAAGYVRSSLSDEEARPATRVEFVAPSGREGRGGEGRFHGRVHEYRELPGNVHIPLLAKAVRDKVSSPRSSVRATSDTDLPPLGTQFARGSAVERATQRAADQSEALSDLAPDAYASARARHSPAARRLGLGDRAAEAAEEPARSAEEAAADEAENLRERASAVLTGAEDRARDVLRAVEGGAQQAGSAVQDLLGRVDARGPTPTVPGSQAEAALAHDMVPSDTATLRAGLGARQGLVPEPEEAALARGEEAALARGEAPASPMGAVKRHVGEAIRDIDRDIDRTVPGAEGELPS